MADVAVFFAADFFAVAFFAADFFAAAFFAGALRFAAAVLLPSPVGAAFVARAVFVAAPEGAAAFFAAALRAGSVPRRAMQRIPRGSAISVRGPWEYARS